MYLHILDDGKMVSSFFELLRFIFLGPRSHKTRSCLRSITRYGMHTKQCSYSTCSNTHKHLHCDVIMGISISSLHTLPHYRISIAAVNAEPFDEFAFADDVAQHQCLYVMTDDHYYQWDYRLKIFQQIGQKHSLTGQQLQCSF